MCSIQGINSYVNTEMVLSISWIFKTMSCFQMLFFPQNLPNVFTSYFTLVLLCIISYTYPFSFPQVCVLLFQSFLASLRPVHHGIFHILFPPYFLTFYLPLCCVSFMSIMNVAETFLVLDGIFYNLSSNIFICLFPCVIANYWPNLLSPLNCPSLLWPDQLHSEVQGHPPQHGK